jgi:hypothetical protein
MIELFQLYKTLNFSRKVQVIRTLAFIQVIAFYLIWHFATNSQVRFYLEAWMGASLVFVIALLLIEITYELKTWEK